MSLANKLEDLVETLQELQEDAFENENRCAKLAEQVLLLTAELGRSRAENLKLHGRLKVLEDDTSKWTLLSKREEITKRAKTGHRYQDALPELGMIENVQKTNRKHPFDVFPEEIWTIIFTHLTEPSDLKNCYDTCREFQSLLHGQRHVLLLSDVLKIISGRTETFLPSTPRLNFTRLKKCRLVCQNWKKSVDNVLQSCSPAACPPNLDPDSHKYSITPVPAFKFSFENNPWIENRMRSFTSNDNPFASRHVEYNEHVRYRSPLTLSNADKIQLRQSFTAFLRKYGHHIWYFTFLFTDLEEDPTGWYFLLLTWLAVMPNLKEFYLSGWTRCETLPDVEEETSRLNFPNIKSLKAVALEDCPGSVVECILNTNPQIESLKVTSYVGYKIDLKSIKLDMVKEAVFAGEFGFPVALKSLNWKLHKLTVDIEMDWDELFRGLSHCFGDTLAELNIDLKNPYLAQHGVRLNLPNLKRLNLRMSYCISAIDFILPLLKLEKLKVTLCLIVCHPCMFDDEEIENRVEIVTLHPFINDLKQSNIWQLFPNLKVASGRVGCYTDCSGHSYLPELTNWHTCTRDQVKNLL